MAVRKQTMGEMIKGSDAGVAAAAGQVTNGIAIGQRSFNKDFVLTPQLEGLAERATRYLAAGTPVHFRGSAGTGKTALALYLARCLGGPVYFLSGDAMRTTESLIGRETGVKTRQIVDRYVHSVRKVENETNINWEADVLTRAALGGGTLVYDEFTRSPAHANNALLSVLEEGVLHLPAAAGYADPCVEVHASFRVIFTSNSLEYAGVQAPPDALLDRMITLDLDAVGAETEIAIVAHRAGLSYDLTARIVAVVRDYRSSGAYDQMPSMRASLMIAQIAAASDIAVDAANPVFQQLVLDVLLSKGAAKRSAQDTESLRQALMQLLSVHCPPSPDADMRDQTLTKGAA